MIREQPVDRRRALAAVAVLAMSGACGPFASKAVDAAKREKKSGKDDRKDKSGRKKKKDKGKKNKGGKKKQSAGASGNKIVKEAMKHKGEKYKLGGASPKGFDCSGFVWYVYDKVAGIDLGRTVKDQYKHGKSVDRGNWKPGDVIFFKNTSDRGLSHDGICIGGDKFIHAENEDTGVVVSSINSDYYKDHYAGTRRML